jgi:hypothetical protein
MPVTNEHELYTEFKGDWEEVRDCVKGNRAIKKKRAKYLPKLSGQKPEAYECYLKKVKFFGATSRTLDGLHGNIFRKAPEQNREVSETFTKSLEDVDLMGTNIEQFVSDIVNDNLQTNWGGILVDYPRGEEALSLADAESKGLRAYLKYYPAENVINWEYKTINGKTQLSMVVLIEPYIESVPGDRFIVRKHNKYRVLYLDEAVKKYRQDVYDDKISLTDPVERGLVIKIQNEEMDEIPFYTLPGNQPEKSMLYDLAQLNLQHYQDSADYQNGKHYTSIPTPIAIGLKPQIDEAMNEPKPMFIGGTEFLFFPNEDHVPGADVKFLEFTGQGMKALAEGIGHLENQMAILGAHIIANEKKGVETAEALRIHRVGENGVLSAFTRNVSNSVTKALRKKGQWDGEDINKINEWAINFNTDYDLSEENVQTLTALLTGRTTGEIPRISLYMGLKSLNLIPEQWDYEMFIEEQERDKLNVLPPISDDQDQNQDDRDDNTQDEPEPPTPPGRKHRPGARK